MTLHVVDVILIFANSLSCIFFSGGTEELQSLSADSLPDYNDLPPSYSNATEFLPKLKKKQLDQVKLLVKN